MRYLFLISLCACGTMNGARPLEKGQHAMGLSIGGPMVEFGGNYIPLPNAVLEGRSGMGEVAQRRWDLNYGLNLTALAFDQVGTHVGANVLIMPQDGGRPAWSVSNRLFVYSNHISSATDPNGKGFWVNDEISTTLSWKLGRQMIYTGLSQYFDLSQPSLTLSPFVGCELFHSGLSNGFALQIELRNYAIGRNPTVNLARWNTPFGSGGFGGSVGFVYRFGGVQ